MAFDFGLSIDLGRSLSPVGDVASDLRERMEGKCDRRDLFEESDDAVFRKAKIPRSTVVNMIEDQGKPEAQVKTAIMHELRLSGSSASPGSSPPKSVRFNLPPESPVRENISTSPSPTLVKSGCQDVNMNEVRMAPSAAVPGSLVVAPDSEKEGHVRWYWMDPVSKKEYTGTKTVACHEEMVRQRGRLPIYQFKEQFINAVQFHSVVVVVGETGSGKSTQMPQYLIEAGLVSGGGGRIAITQPRRVAAVSVAARVAEEVGCKLGEMVGYAIRFEDMSSSHTVLKYMTDGMLLMECLRDPLFAAYGCVILDEAHERTLHTDILLGLLKKAIAQRPELKVIITSATLDIKKFADYFGAPMVKIPGKIYPVNIRYMPFIKGNKKSQDGTRPLWTLSKKTDQYIQRAVDKVLEIHRDVMSDSGDILVFLPGKEEVEQACALIMSAQVKIMALPVYAALPFDAQCQIFNATPAGVRKVIIATNIAETSITIDGISYVVDAGFFKESIYDHGIDTLRVTVISKAQAEQRAGRAGRTAPGTCYRLYTQDDYERMKAVPVPAIHRIDFASTALQLKAMGIDDICGFGFMDPPREDRVLQALDRLWVLGALDGSYRVTQLGFQMAEFPLLPNLSKILLTAAEMECSDEVLTIVSMLSVKYVFVRPKRKWKEADAKKERFNDEKGDHLTLLNVFNQWRKNGMSEEWAKENFLHQKELEKAMDIRVQLQGLMKVHGVPIVSAGRYLSNIRKALSTGEPRNVAVLESFFYAPNGAYRTLIDNQQVFIHPSSALYHFNPLPQYVIYHETITTTRNFMRTVSICEGTWVQKLLGRR